MQRRAFIAGLAGAAAWPVAAHAQGTRVPVVGLLSGVAFDGPYAVPVTAIRQGLEEAGFVEGRNLAIESRAADGRYERLPELAADLVRGHAEVIVTIGASKLEPAVTAAASTVPIVFAMGTDTVALRLVDGVRGPEADAAGMAPDADIASKRLDLLLELRPGASLLGYLDNSRLSGTFETNVENMTAAARAKGRDLAVFDAGTEREVDTAFTQMALQRVRALVIGPDPFLTSRQEQIIALAAQSALPAVYATRGAAVRGGLISYGVLTDDMYRIAGISVGRILNGATPAELPIALPVRFELIVNNRTARSLRITVPRRLLIRASEVIE